MGNKLTPELKQQIKIAFDHFDEDHSGEITVDELQVSLSYYSLLPLFICSYRKCYFYNYKTPMIKIIPYIQYDAIHI
jgi:hypothetical protein